MSGVTKVRVSGVWVPIPTVVREQAGYVEDITDTATVSVLMDTIVNISVSESPTTYPITVTGTPTVVLF